MILTAMLQSQKRMPVKGPLNNFYFLILNSSNIGLNNQEIL